MEQITLDFEIWKDVVGYEGWYEVSNFRRVKRLRRQGTVSLNEDRILKPHINNGGYYVVNLSKDGKRKPLLLHVLIATAFIQNPDNMPEVDHMFGDKSDNRIEVLRWCSHRQNITYHHLTKNNISQYTGVCWSIRRHKWNARIYYNGKAIWLGNFATEIDAHRAYQKALKETNEGIFVPPVYMYSSKYKGVSWDKKARKWVAYIYKNGKKFSLGCFFAELEAYNAIERQLEILKQIKKLKEEL